MFVSNLLFMARTTGKFNYQLESSYSVGTVGYEDVDCDCIDHTYVRYVSIYMWFIDLLNNILSELLPQGLILFLKEKYLHLQRS